MVTSNLETNHFNIDGNGRLYVSAKGDLITLFFNNLPVQDVSYGNVGNIPEQIRPKVTSIMHNVNDDHIILIDLDGKITLYSNDLNAYVTGNVIACITYVRD